MNTVQEKSDSAPRRPSTLARRADLAERLVALAEAAIDAAGVQELRARALAEAAGCSVGAIYGVFPDLDELILAVNSRTLGVIDSALTRAAKGARTPAQQMDKLASAYLHYALHHRGRWSALFQHRMAQGRPVPDWYAARLDSAFAHIEMPLRQLRPDLQGPARAQLARTVFSAVHGVVELGLSGKAGIAVPGALQEQLRVVVAALATGLAHDRDVGAK